MVAFKRLIVHSSSAELAGLLSFLRTIQRTSWQNTVYQRYMLIPVNQRTDSDSDFDSTIVRHFSHFSYERTNSPCISHEHESAKLRRAGQPARPGAAYSACAYARAFYYARARRHSRPRTTQSMIQTHDQKKLLLM